MENTSNGVTLICSLPGFTVTHNQYSHLLLPLYLLLQLMMKMMSWGDDDDNCDDDGDNKEKMKDVNDEDK